MIGVCLAALLAAGDGGDPRALFADGQYPAAAAAFESRWRAEHRAVDGVNAAVAWRSAGRYARARALLGEVLREASVGEPLKSRAELLRKRLEELTGTLVLTGDPVPSDAPVTVDGAAAERDGDAVLVDVGARELLVRPEGCDAVSWRGTVRPATTVPVEVTLTCARVPGSVHVTLERAAGATVTIDGKDRELEVSDLAQRLAPGPHRVRLARRGLTLLDRTVEVPSGGEVALTRLAPWRAQDPAFTIGVVAPALVAPRTATGVGIAGHAPLFARRGAAPGSYAFMELAGGLTNAIEPTADAGTWVMATVGWWRVLPPLPSFGTSVPWSVSVEPLTAWYATRADDAVEGASQDFWGFGAIVVDAELPAGAHLELRAFPASWSRRYSGGGGIVGPERTAGEKRWSPSFTAAISWRVGG